MNFEKRRWDRQLVKFFLHLMANEWLDYGGNDYEFSDEEDDDENENEREYGNGEDEKEEWKLEGQAYDEMRLQVQCLKMYRTELEELRNDFFGWGSTGIEPEGYES